VQRVNLDVPGQFEQELIGYRITPEAAAIGQSPSRLRLPEGARALAVIREQRSLSVSEVQGLESDDYLYLLAPGRTVGALDKLFAAMPQPDYLEEHHFFGDFVLKGDARIGDVSAAYGFKADADTAAQTLAEYLAKRFKRRPVVGDRCRLGSVELVVRELREGDISLVGLRLAPK
jgi:potassium/hydrogen antiporter